MITRFTSNGASLDLGPRAIRRFREKNALPVGRRNLLLPPSRPYNTKYPNIFLLIIRCRIGSIFSVSDLVSAEGGSARLPTNISTHLKNTSKRLPLLAVEVTQERIDHGSMITAQKRVIWKNPLERVPVI